MSEVRSTSGASERPRKCHTDTGIWNLESGMAVSTNVHVREISRRNGQRTNSAPSPNENAHLTSLLYLYCENNNMNLKKTFESLCNSHRVPDDRYPGRTAACASILLLLLLLSSCPENASFLRVAPSKRSWARRYVVPLGRNLLIVLVVHVQAHLSSKRTAGHTAPHHSCVMT